MHPSLTFKNPHKSFRSCHYVPKPFGVGVEIEVEDSIDRPSFLNKRMSELIKQ